MAQDFIQTTQPTSTEVDSGAYFERRIARLLIVMYYCGEPVHSLLEGETRQINSLIRLQQFDFWVREPGHLALALLHARAATPALFADTDSTLRAAINRMMTAEAADRRRIDTPSNFDDLDNNLSFLTSRALVSDRPSFIKSRSGNHQVILESAGVEFVQQILKECPTFDWYRAQAESVLTFWPVLNAYDVTLMPYLEPEFTPAWQGSMVSVIQARYQTIFGETSSC